MPGAARLRQTPARAFGDREVQAARGNLAGRAPAADVDRWLDGLRAIAERSGGTAFEQGDLSTPQVNISYGVYYLRAVTDTPEGRTYARPRRQGALEVVLLEHGQTVFISITRTRQKFKLLFAAARVLEERLGLLELSRGRRSKTTEAHTDSLRTALGRCTRLVLSLVSPSEVPKVCASVASPSRSQYISAVACSSVRSRSSSNGWMRPSPSRQHHPCSMHFAPASTCTRRTTWSRRSRRNRGRWCPPARRPVP